MKNRNKYSNAILVLFILHSITFFGCTNQTKNGQDPYVVFESTASNFPIVANGKATPVFVDQSDYKGILRVAKLFQNDISKVTSVEPQLLTSDLPKGDFVIIVGSIEKSPIIKKLISEGKIEGSQLQGKWEKFITQIVQNPTDGIKKALVIAGSDKRGAIYGMFDISKQMGVSPWYFWADVPVEKHAEVYVSSGMHTQGEPKVKYRGIFINDEAPALTGWAHDNYGKFNADFYDKVFELLLRLKANYLWPAMWQPRKFYVDDPENAVLADEYGIVMGTSHHEPLTRAHAEWNSKVDGPWDFSTNADNLIKFWKGGMERMGDKETLVTIGMRGDGDAPMTQGTAIELLESIVKAQRDIIKEVTKKPVEETPQIWALYKEVQDYYDKGMKVPDDVTLLLCDDNWGNLRKLPSLDAAPRKGGYGIYYHFDYVGGPRNYKWINTRQIERTWEQMHLAYEHGVDKVWIVNVGDIKPMEFPISFFMDYAWNPEAWNSTNLPTYYTEWASQNFNGQFTDSIAHILKSYTKYNSLRTPELLDANTFSLLHYKEFEKAVNNYQALADQARDIYNKLSPEYQAAFYELVMYPVEAMANLYQMYFDVAKNKLYADQGRAATNSTAAQVKVLFEKDEELSNYYNTKLLNGKWNHMMDQSHIGYRIWQEPRGGNRMPETQTINLPKTSEVGVSVEGSDLWWPESQTEVKLPAFYSYNGKVSHFVEIFNRGTVPFDFQIKSGSKWLKFSKSKGKISEQERIDVSIDWNKAPKGSKNASFIIEALGKKIPVNVVTNKEVLNDARGFVETNGYISMSAEDFSKKTEPGDFSWTIVDNFGKTGSSVISLPIKKGRIPLTQDAPKLSYDFYLKHPGKVKVHMYFAPTINYTTREGMYYGLGIDNQSPKKVNYDADPNIFNYNGKVPKHWGENVSDHIKIITTELNVDSIGNHTLNYYRVDEGLVLEKIVIETEKSQMEDSYLGPPESFQSKD